MADKTGTLTTWKGTGEAIVVPSLPSISDEITATDPEVSFTTSPQESQFTYTVGSTTYSPAGAYWSMVNGTITFTATFAGATVIEYHWDFGDGVEGWGNPVTHIYEIPNQHIQAVLRVTDTLGRRFYTRKQMYLKNGEGLPTATDLLTSTSLTTSA